MKKKQVLDDNTQARPLARSAAQDTTHLLTSYISHLACVFSFTVYSFGLLSQLLCQAALQHNKSKRERQSFLSPSRALLILTCAHQQRALKRSYFIGGVAPTIDTNTNTRHKTQRPCSNKLKDGLPRKATKENQLQPYLRRFCISASVASKVV